MAPSSELIMNSKNCPICNSQIKNVNLKCHIIPDFIHRNSTSDKTNRSIHLQSSGIRKIKQTSMFGKGIFCKECEVKFGKIDRRAANGLMKVIESHRENNTLVNKFVTVKYETKAFKEFIFSIILRQHCYSIKYEKTDLLGPNFDLFKVWFLENKLHKADYPIIVYNLIYGVDLTPTIYPFKTHTFGPLSIETYFLGLKVVVVTAKKYKRSLIDPLSNSDKLLRLFNLNIDEDGILKSFIKNHKKFKRKRE